MTHAAALLVYAILTVAYTWPVALRIGQLVPHDPGDPLLSTWTLWWNAQARTRARLAFMPRATAQIEIRGLHKVFQLDSQRFSQVQAPALRAACTPGATPPRRVKAPLVRAVPVLPPRQERRRTR